MCTAGAGLEPRLDSGVLGRQAGLQGEGGGRCGAGWVGIPDSLSCRVCTSFCSCSSSRRSEEICRASAVGGPTREQLVLRQQPLGRTRPGPAGSPYLEASGSSPSSPALDNGASAPGRPAAQSCFQGPDWGKQVNAGWQRPHPQSHLHCPASKHSVTQETPTVCRLCPQPWAPC